MSHQFLPDFTANHRDIAFLIAGLSGERRENSFKLRLGFGDATALQELSDTVEEQAATPPFVIEALRCDDGVLVVKDVAFENDPAMMERYLVCDACGAGNAMRMPVN